METIEKGIIFGLSNSMKIVDDVCKTNDNVELGESTVKKFADGEIFVQVDTSVRNRKVFVVQSTQKPVNDSLMELLLFIDALKRASVKEINVIIPYFGYARQDRKVKGRQSISAKLVADMLEVAGANRVITFDIHSEQTQGFFNIPVDILRATGILANEIKKLDISDLTIVSPDQGGAVRARRLAEQMGGIPLAIIDKRRTNHNEVEVIDILGDVKDRNIVIFDDIIDTGGTICASVQMLKDNGAKDIYVAATHGVLSIKDGKSAKDKLMEAGIKKIIITNSITNDYDDSFVIADLSESISGVIKSHLKNESITNFFIKEYSTTI